MCSLDIADDVFESKMVVIHGMEVEMTKSLDEKISFGESALESDTLEPDDMSVNKRIL
ncbi:hypothetical protein DPMN_119912 [Dreissena polymorpha]|uniref:Uncharacterized protein n=1 Tax=Dreissena polymorpha TaxID=45954 RepID=A0A9D4GMJ4_DREPO|nr:hypothetical protein DPMN_119912 [Dreissena polymorpha]